ncbi:GNAT family N-acetyltransferase [Paenibacillus sp. J5C_2022]|uniref:GNAT family N-acetyltransferase n=1 Tax=Paenibacillus sp. J5C2022 TaxID=2977129 RepID=UPI0021D364DE|nr:GNAT family N-acetyltransferase [Paenibacillus sp. J5C2022]MCU6708796.1 GNAT family N-acetyltransferase [Paenibacillus sp. J5C2022]
MSADRLMIDVPESFESERMLIRAPRRGDGAMVNEAVRESIEELRPWMPWAESVPTPEESEAELRGAIIRYLERTDLRLLLIDKASGKLVGSSGLHRMNWSAGAFEIGYWLRTSCTGQGYMHEAVQAITEWTVAELGANRIEIRCDSRNTASKRVAERAGYTLEGILRQQERAVDGTLRDTMVFSKVRGVEFG